MENGHTGDDTLQISGQLQINTHVCLFVCLFVFAPEGFTTLVTNEGLEKARAYLNQMPWDQRLYTPSEGCV